MTVGSLIQIQVINYFVVLPEVQLWIDETNVSVGDRVTVKCQIRQQGRPQAKISWYHDRKLVPGESGRYLFNQKEIELKDAGSYQCVANNSAGENKSEVIRITVKEKPEEGEKGSKVKFIAA